ncbi:hypothetical protein glysoja_007492 [Glycine soja]|nr:hypothetical protein glysoja_007492 [Glycine soja]
MAVESIFEGVNCIFCGIFLFMANPVLKQLDVVSKLTRSSSKNEWIDIIRGPIPPPQPLPPPTIREIKPKITSTRMMGVEKVHLG